MPRSHSSSGVETVTRQKAKVKRPKLYKVILLNDDFTSMDFVVAVLEGIFGKSPAESVRIMLQVHHKGSGLCGIYPKEIAETKVALVHQKAREHNYPLRCSMEEE